MKENNLGSRIKIIREKKGLTRERVCGDQTNLTVRQLFRIEHLQCNPSIKKIEFICDSLDVPIEEILNSKHIFIPNEYFTEKFKIINSLLYTEEELNLTKKNLEHIFKLYFKNLPEFEQEAINTLNLSYLTCSQEMYMLNDMTLSSYFYHLNNKNIYSFNELLIIHYLFLNWIYSKILPTEFNFLLKKIINNVSSYQLGNDLTLINRILIAAMGVCIIHNKIDTLPNLIFISKKIMIKNKDFYRKPIVYMVEARYYTFKKKKEKEQYKFKKAYQLATLQGNTNLANIIHKESKK